MPLHSVKVPVIFKQEDDQRPNHKQAEKVTVVIFEYNEK